MFGRRKKRQPPSTEPTVPEHTVGRVVGTPMSHESVLLLARLQGVADRLESAVIRLEAQAPPEEGDDA